VGGAVVTIWLIQAVISGLLAAYIWSSKGGSFGAGFWLGALFGLLGLLFVGFANPQGAANLGSGSSSLVSGQSSLKKCPMCAEDDIRADAKICKHCGHVFQQPDEEVKSDRRPNRDDGKDLTDVVEFAFGVRWARDPDGRILYQEPGSQAWLVYKQGQTAYVPPPGFLAAGQTR
jgi:hypothetical protein